ncbi:MAG: hypothetical protein GY703_07515 [Gammaproteobacteria bacterium]|nr:hypothetical protein [Gammaproteobacteria bacterium]
MAVATFRFYAELNDFLGPERRQRDSFLTFVPPTPVGHLVETLGVPHTEVLLSNCRPGFESGTRRYGAAGVVINSTGRGVTTSVCVSESMNGVENR